MRYTIREITSDWSVIDYPEYFRDEETGDWVFDPPKPDDWGYERYIAYKSVVDEIKALV